MAGRAIAKKRIKVGNRWLEPGDEVTQWRFFKPRAKQKLINTGKVEIEVVKKDDVDLQRESG